MRRAVGIVRRTDCVHTFAARQADSQSGVSVTGVAYRTAMTNFISERSRSLSVVVLILLITFLLQGSITYSTAYGKLEHFIVIPGWQHGVLPAIWLGVRVLALLVVIVLWVLNRKTALFKAIIVFNTLLILGLLSNMVALISVLFGLTAQAVRPLLGDVVLMATTDVLIFSVWYWIIDPPGVEETQRGDAPWDFLFPQRGDALPHYESWQPRYADYLYLAFTTSFAFSPTDTLPLTRRAKMLMLLQSSISLITLTAIAGSAINILAGSS